MTQHQFYTLPPTQSVLSHLTEYLLAQNQQDPFLLSEIQVVLPTRRSVRKLKQCLLDRAPNSTLLLPKIQAINDLTPPLGVHIQPEMPATLRLGLMLNLLKSAQGQFPSVDLAQQLCAFIDQLHIEEANLMKLNQIIPDQFAQHWQLSLAFLNLLQRKWPGIVKQHDYLEPYLYRRHVWNAITDLWQNTKPTHPVIAAGLTGDIPAVGCLLKCIASLPRGQVILPGFDTTITDWQTIKPTHPQYTHKRFFERETLDLNAVQSKSRTTARDLTIKALMNRDLSQEKVSVQGIQCIELETTQDEAESVALIIRAKLTHADQTIAVISPDRSFNHRLRMELQRWKIDIDDSAGIPLTETALGYLMLETAQLPDFEQDPTRTVAILKHPLVTLGYARSELLNLVRTLESQVLRAQKNLSDLSASLFDRVTKRCQDQRIIGLIQHWKQSTRSFYALQKQPEIHFKTLLESHLLLLENLSSKDTLWDSEAGQALVPQLQKLMGHADHMDRMTIEEYAKFLKIFLHSITIHESFSHPRVQLLGPIEARLIESDWVILTNMNEGTWPTTLDLNPWLNRTMQRAIGLPDPEIQIGQEALDFTLALGHKNIILTRAMRSDGALTTPSRWLLRLKTLAACNDENLTYTDPLNTWHQLLDQPIYDLKITEPAPCPSISLRPRTLTISDIDLLIKDAYSFYAKNILKLYPLDQMEIALTPVLFGIWIHRILQNHPTRESLAQYSLAKNVDPIWAYQFEAIKDWLLTQTEFDVPTEQLFTEKRLTNTLQELEIIGKADRIQLTADGIAIIDYKTGSLPTQQEIKTGLAPQLPLLALLADQPIQQLAYWDLKNQEIRNLADPESLIATYKQMIESLLENYLKAETTFKSATVLKGERHSPYQHLKRAQEWLNNSN